MTHDEISQLVEAINGSLAICHKEVLTLDEAARYTGLKKASLYKLTSARVIPHSKPNGKNCFFNRKALEEWMMGNPVATAADINAEAQAYCQFKKSTL